MTWGAFLLSSQQERCAGPFSGALPGEIPLMGGAYQAGRAWGESNTTFRSTGRLAAVTIKRGWG